MKTAYLLIRQEGKVCKTTCHRHFFILKLIYIDVDYVEGVTIKHGENGAVGIPSLSNGECTVYDIGNGENLKFKYRKMFV